MHNVSATTCRALFVAIDKYPEGSGWSLIHAANDYEIIIPMLKKKGFADENIFVLLNEEATKANIEKKLDEIFSLSDKGDYIYIHFSCHGQQMFDDNGDEPDGLDEAIIPYDAQRRYKKGIYEGENHLRDDMLGRLTDNIRYKIGNKGNMVIILDACHSGTGTREGDDDEYIRGTGYVFAPEGYVYPKIDPDKVRFNLNNNKYMSPVTVISACKDSEINYEYKDENNKYYGALSYALGKLQGLSSAQVSTRKFIEKLKEEMQVMFASKRWQQTPYVESTDIKRVFEIGKTR
ncbi:MAG: caspase family protein [Dysgonomonas sp.]